MALANYSDLTTAVENWSSISDLDSRIPEFIALAEQRMWYGDALLGHEPLRVAGMETTGDLTINAQSVAKPTGFLEARRLYLNTDPTAVLAFMVPTRFWNSIASTSGKPKVFTVEGENFKFKPTPDSSYTGKLLYFVKLTGLSDSNTTNWIITNIPSVYLFGTLLEQCIYDEDDEGIVKFGKLYGGAVASANRQFKNSRYSGGELRAYPDTVR